MTNSYDVQSVTGFSLDGIIQLVFSVLPSIIFYLGCSMKKIFHNYCRQIWLKMHVLTAADARMHAPTPARTYALTQTFILTHTHV